MKPALDKGGAADLNVYTVGFNSGAGAGLFGYSTFPAAYGNAPVDGGVVIDYGTVSDALSISHGKTLAHETGPWLGLYHTCQGGRSSPGDYVDDTLQRQFLLSFVRHVYERGYLFVCLSIFGFLASVLTTGVPEATILWTVPMKSVEPSSPLDKLFAQRAKFRLAAGSLRKLTPLGHFVVVFARAHAYGDRGK